MQCKDIPDGAVLTFLSERHDEFPSATWFRSDDYKPSNSVVNAMPVGTNAKLALAKMRTLIRRGLVTGCPCGCRGDFELTAAGREALSRSMAH